MCKTSRLVRISLFNALNKSVLLFFFGGGKLFYKSNRKLSRILPTPSVFISGYANTENVFYCLNVSLSNEILCHPMVGCSLCTTVPFTQKILEKERGAAQFKSPFVLFTLILITACHTPYKRCNRSKGFLMTHKHVTCHLCQNSWLEKVASKLMSLATPKTFSTFSYGILHMTFNLNVCI